MLPTRAEIAELEQELGFPFRTAHFTVPVADTEPGDTAFYRHDVMPSDMVRKTTYVRYGSVDELFLALCDQEDFLAANHQAEDRNVELFTNNA